MTLFRKVLIANRGEIALRVIRACRELGIASVAVYSDADRDALHVTAADEAYRIGPPPASQSYLAVDSLMEVAQRANCDAVHPGYGFLAENAGFARRCGEEGLMFIGPSPQSIEAMGDKIAARVAAQAAGVPIVPGTSAAVTDADSVRQLGERFGYPIAVKASAGGGGRGLKVVRAPAEAAAAFEFAAKEAASYFSNNTVYVERYFEHPKHVEVQVLADRHGNVIHLGERDCSMQRRHQKLIEETPACISTEVRSGLLAAAVKLARSIGYDSAGTVECLVAGDRFYFLEMNTRIQVEHTVTEMTWGVDLVKAQIRVVAGERLWLKQADLAPRGHAIECRINAESPTLDFRPCAGLITRYIAPSGPGVRVDAAAFTGYVVPQEYDSLLGKLIVWGGDREEARRRMLRALGEYQIEGIDTTVPFLRLLFESDDFKSGKYMTPTVVTLLSKQRDALAKSPSVSEISAAQPQETTTLTVEVNSKRFEVRVAGGMRANGASAPTTRRARKFYPTKRVETDGAAVVAPMHGIVAEIRVAPGDSVQDGQVVAVIEAMKMMNEVTAHRHGTVAKIEARLGQTIETGAPIVTFA
jgi:acetyl-CoA/propionyl-CoA carboxylase biotin carboxyl carrier protein